MELMDKFVLAFSMDSSQEVHAINGYHPSTESSSDGMGLQSLFMRVKYYGITEQDIIAVCEGALKRYPSINGIVLFPEEQQIPGESIFPEQGESGVKNAVNKLRVRLAESKLSS